MSASQFAETTVEHVDGVPWWEAPLPGRIHECRVQTHGVIRYFEVVERCACGALRYDGRGPWIGRNSRSRLDLDPADDTHEGQSMDRDLGSFFDDDGGEPYPPRGLRYVVAYVAAMVLLVVAFVFLVAIS